MLAMLLFVALADETESEIPRGARRFFEVAYDSRDKEVAELEQKRKKLETLLEYETKRELIGRLKGQVKNVDKELERARHLDFSMNLRDDPHIGDIAFSRGGTVLAVIDEETVLLKREGAANGLWRGAMLVIGQPTKGLKSRQRVVLPGVWEVIAEKPTRDDVIKAKGALSPGGGYIEVRQVAPDMLEKWRVQFEAERERKKTDGERPNS